MLILISQKKVCDDYRPGKLRAFSLDFCRSTNFDDSAKCCFVKFEDKNENRLYHCYPINKEQWADIDKLESTLEENYKVVSIECGASYFSISSS